MYTQKSTRMMEPDAIDTCSKTSPSSTLPPISQFVIVSLDRTPLVSVNHILNPMKNQESAEPTNLLDKKGKNKTFTCTYCYRVFTSYSPFQKHFKVHSNDRFYSCSLCGKKFKSSSHIKSHISVIHLKERNFKCSFCNHTFSMRSNLRLHEATLHDVTRQLVCNICSCRFLTKHSLQHHINYVHLKHEFTCKICNKSFTKASTYNTHMDNHSNINPLYKCKGCNRTYKTCVNFIKHLNEVTSLTQYYCNLCNVSFKLLCAYKKHVKNHYLEKEAPFMCDLCSKLFWSKSGLIVHQWMHRTNGNEKEKENAPNSLPKCQ